MTYKTFQSFYPFYLSQHQNPICRTLHVIGTALLLSVLTFSMLSGELKLLFSLPVIGYGFAWIGHFIFEKNRPATFKYPLYSLMGDFKMFWDVVTGKISLRSKE
jgi:hypothetical protein